MLFIYIYILLILGCLEPLGYSFKDKTFDIRGVTPFICWILNYQHISVAVALLCSTPSSQPGELEGSNTTASPSNPNPQSTTNKKRRGQAHLLAELNSSATLQTQVMRLAPQGTQMNRVRRMKSVTQNLRSSESSHLHVYSMFTYKPQGRLLWV